MDIQDIKNIIKDLPNNMPVKFCTGSMWITEDINIEMEDDEEWYGEPSLIISAKNI